MATKSVLRERVGDGVDVLRLDRPQARNALDSATIDQLLAALDDLAADGDVRVLVLSTTSERAFCAGADLAERLDRAGGVARMEAFARLYAAVEAFPAPTVCVCVGNCVGAGAEIAAGCDLRVGGDNLRLSWPGARLGVPIGPARLVPLVGLAVAKELIFTGRTIGMEEARELRLLARCAPAAEAEAQALDLAAGIAAHPSAGLRRLKAMFREYEDLAARVADENGRLVAFQRDDAGLPMRA
ncbi:enoyl-CoA hydratase/isomerase family protein [Capillimicrobium parvum]|uniref:2,3-dehydroadipyl-CoA hydratase n=1 Tax=Capillimicrobium parvum TaxID=2884022 RepID=A0A9E7C053_9ACTN|nr:enoyl-CoA hydratase/isomerase family protein [Capillimicrobium parvum]UGS35172.1 2,3-dehydroadipyl-CoA hydratase [Capillimicrobium parvum]